MVDGLCIHRNLVKEVTARSRCLASQNDQDGRRVWVLPGQSQELERYKSG